MELTEPGAVNERRPGPRRPTLVPVTWDFFPLLPSQQPALEPSGEAWKLNSGFGIANSSLELNCLSKRQAPSPSLVYLWAADSSLIEGRGNGRCMCYTGVGES